VLLEIAAVAVLGTSAPSTVELTVTGPPGPPVAMGPRTLSDVARERREGRRAVGGFSAAETTVPRVPVDLSGFNWDEDTARREPDVEPQAPAPPYVLPYADMWYGGGYGGGAKHRRPHVVHHGTRPTGRPFGRPDARLSPRPGSGASPRPTGMSLERHGGLSGPSLRRPG
jgi:hypothetical protein